MEIPGNSSYMRRHLCKSIGVINPTKYLAYANKKQRVGRFNVSTEKKKHFNVGTLKSLPNAIIVE